MSEKKPDHNTECTDDKHGEHLCFLMYEGYHYEHRADYKALVQDAEYICRNCSRTAKDAARLCAPEKL